MASISHLLLFLLSSIYIHRTMSQYVKCDGDCSCPAIPSTPGETCILDCGTGQDKCKEHKLYCRAGDPCVILCDAKATCSAGTKIFASTATDVSITCSGDDSCKDYINIECGTGDCKLECDGSTSCETFGKIDVSNSKSFECIGNCPNKVPDQFTASPTREPTKEPTNSPSKPTKNPTNAPSMAPSHAPSAVPSIPTKSPTLLPTNDPSVQPTKNPSDSPTHLPSSNPSSQPTPYPSINPTSLSPTTVPSLEPTLSPTNNPAINPISVPTSEPTQVPSKAPSRMGTTFDPTSLPTQSPSRIPTKSPSVVPSVSPTKEPSQRPTLTDDSVSFDSDEPSDPTVAPTRSPTVVLAQNITDPLTSYATIIISVLSFIFCCLFGLITYLLIIRIKAARALNVERKIPTSSSANRESVNISLPELNKLDGTKESSLDDIPNDIEMQPQKEVQPQPPSIHKLHTMPQSAQSYPPAPPPPAFNVNTLQLHNQGSMSGVSSVFGMPPHIAPMAQQYVQPQMVNPQQNVPQYYPQMSTNQKVWNYQNAQSMQHIAAPSNFYTNQPQMQMQYLANPDRKMTTLSEVTNTTNKDDEGTNDSDDGSLSSVSNSETNSDSNSHSQSSSIASSH